MGNTARARSLTARERELIVADVLSAIRRRRRALLIRSAKLAFTLAMTILTIAVGLHELGIL
jgi:hypothetical protein